MCVESVACRSRVFGALPTTHGGGILLAFDSFLKGYVKAKRTYTREVGKKCACVPYGGEGESKPTVISSERTL
jgi:hypothetical protein